MVAKEAIKWQKTFKKFHGFTKEATDACELAIKALRKQKVLEENPHDLMVCRVCEKEYGSDYEYYCYCPLCGRRLEIAEDLFGYDEDRETIS